MTVHTFLWFHLEEFYVFTSSDSGIENWTLFMLLLKRVLLLPGRL